MDFDAIAKGCPWRGGMIHPAFGPQCKAISFPPTSGKHFVSLMGGELWTFHKCCEQTCAPLFWLRRWRGRMSKQYDVPDSTALLMDKALAAEQMRDICVKIPFFGFKRARQCAVDAITFRRKFWSEIGQMYPELPERPLTYLPTKQVVQEAPDGDR